MTVTTEAKKEAHLHAPIKGKKIGEKFGKHHIFNEMRIKKKVSLCSHCINDYKGRWCERGDSNPHGVATRTSNVLVYHSNTLANLPEYYNLDSGICQ